MGGALKVYGCPEGTHSTISIQLKLTVCRLARMTVEIREHQILIDSRNTHMFSVSRRAYGQLFEDDATTLIVDGQELALSMDESYARHETIFFVRSQRTWEVRHDPCLPYFLCLISA